jgi:O-antigen/teichoic acid export membrane protein
MSSTGQAVKPSTAGSEIRTAVRHTAVYGLGAVAIKALGFLLLPMYTRLLAPRDYGILEILDLTMSLLGMFLNMGMTAALLRFHASVKTDRERKEVVSTAMIFVTVTGALMFVIAVSCYRAVSARLFGADVPPMYLLLSFASFVLAYVANLPRTYLRAVEASGTFVMLDTVSVFIMLVMNVVFIAVLRIGISGILLSALIVNVAWIWVSVWVVRKVGIRFNIPLVRGMLAFGLPLIFSNLGMFVLNFADRFFLKQYQGLEVVGIYAVGYKFGFMMNFLLIQPFYGMWQARMYLIYGRPDHPGIFGEMFVLYSSVLTYAGLALAILSPEIIHLMVGPQFASGASIVPLVVLAYVFYGVGYYAQLGMFLSNRTKTIGWISAGAAVLNAGLNYSLIVRFGMMGAAWATTLSFLAIAAASYWCSQKILPLPLSIARVAGAFAIAAAAYFAGNAWKFESVTAAVGLKVILLALYPAALWKARIFSPREKSTIGSAWETARTKASRLFQWAPQKGVSL